MAFQYSPKIVTDGLVLCLDAANPKSIISGATTWADMSRSGNNGTLINGIGYDLRNGGNLIFDGVNDVIYAGNGLNYPYPYNTFEVWVKSSGLASGMTIGGLIGLDYGRTFHITANGNLQYVWYSGATPLFNIVTTNINIFDNKWHQVVCSRGTSLSSVYVDGLLITSGSNGGASSWNGLNQWSSMVAMIGNNPNDVFYKLKGSISLVRGYSRGLTNNEIQQNYNTTKSRFGL